MLSDSLKARLTQGKAPTDRDWADYKSGLQALILAGAPPFSRSDCAAQGIPYDREARKAAALADPLLFGQWYLPHYCTKPFAPFHREIAALFQRPGNVCAVVCGFRESAKSVVAGLIAPLWAACAGRVKFVVGLGHTADLAIASNIARGLEFERNRRIIEDFGEQLRPNAWADGDFVCSGLNCRFLARGYEQPIRGLKHGAARIQMAILDDMESGETVGNPRLVEKKEHWFLTELIPGVRDGWIVWLGNAFDRRSAMHKMMVQAQAGELDGIEFLRIDPRDAAGRLTWPEHMDEARLAFLEKTMRRRAYQAEMFHNPLDPGGIFKLEDFHFYRVAELSSLKIVRCLEAMDSKAKGRAGKSLSAVVRIAKLDDGRLILLPDFILGMQGPAELAKLICGRFAAPPLGIPAQALVMEEVGFQTLFREVFATAGEKLGVQVPIHISHLSGAKEDRIAGLEYVIRDGKLLFPHPQDEPRTHQVIDHFLYLAEPAQQKDAADAIEQCVRELTKARPNYSRAGGVGGRTGAGLDAFAGSLRGLGGMGGGSAAGLGRW